MTRVRPKKIEVLNKSTGVTTTIISNGTARCKVVSPYDNNEHFNNPISQLWSNSQ